MLSSGRHLSKEERFFNSQCEFKEGALYVFPKEVEARSILGDNPRVVEFKTALFLYGREHRALTGAVLGHDFLFMPNSDTQITFVSLTFGDESELPKRIGLFRKPGKWLECLIGATLVRQQIGMTFRRGEVYEWSELVSANTVNKSMVRDGTGKRIFGPRLVYFRRALYNAYHLKSDEHLFEVEVLGEDGTTVVGRDNVALRISKKNHPRLVHSNEPKP